MPLLLDTHALIWWLTDDKSLSAAAYAAIQADNAVCVSAATVWEIATKSRIGRLPMGDIKPAELEAVLEEQGFAGVPITLRHAQVAGSLPGPHREPFDRMLIAQAMVDDLVLVSNERAFAAYGVRLLW